MQVVPSDPWSEPVAATVQRVGQEDIEDLIDVLGRIAWGTTRSVTAGQLSIQP